MLFGWIVMSFSLSSFGSHFFICRFIPNKLGQQQRASWKTVTAAQWAKPPACTWWGYVLLNFGGQIVIYKQNEVLKREILFVGHYILYYIESNNYHASSCMVSCKCTF